MSSPVPLAPTFEHHHSGLGVAQASPRISWQLESSAQTVSGWQQTSYEVEIASPPSAKPTVTRVESDQSVLVPWPAQPLRSHEGASIRVRVFGKSADRSSEPSSWSPTATVETALLDPKEFKANFITASRSIDTNAPIRPLRLRKTFQVPENVTDGRLYITALGVFDVHINGKLASDELLAPGWTSYNHRLAYRVLDVSHLLVPGKTNAICAEVAEGWYAGRLGFAGGKRCRWGSEIALAAQLEFGDGDGRSTVVSTDGTWEIIESAIISSEFYDGEKYDAREDLDDWKTAATQWPSSRKLNAKILERPRGKLVVPDAPPVRVTETVRCQKVFKSSSGKTVLDFGQNLVGKVYIPRLDLPAGQTVTFTHTEVLENGEVATRPLRIAKCQDHIVGNGKTIADWTPRFTFHGFRYVQVDGWPGDIRAEDIQALFMHSDMKRRGHFECSNPVVNRLHENVVRSMRGNFVSIPTDCPQRDERLGWTGDLQAFCPTGTFLYETVGVLSSWLEDVAAEQLNDGKYGVVPLVVPYAMEGFPDIAQAVWDDVAIVAPGELYRHSSDKDLLARQFASMQAWLDSGVERAPDGLWDPEKWQLADWLDPIAPPERPDLSRTDSVLVANAFLVRVTLRMAELCKALGRDDLATKYADDGKRLRSLFQQRYITPDGNLMSTSQTGLSIAVCFGLYPENAQQRKTATAALDHLVRKESFHIATGFAGTPWITHALTAVGRPQLAYRMLLETKCPSWMYPIISHGATTVWERWDSMLQDGSVNPGEMTSFNHYSFGSVADWLHTTVGGISPAEPGWRKIRVRPVPGGNITSAKVTFDSPYGRVACEWQLAGKKFTMELTVPANCSAAVTLPSEIHREWAVDAEHSRTVMSGVHRFECEFVADEWPPAEMICITLTEYTTAQSLPTRPGLQRNGKYCLVNTGITAEFIPYGASLTNLFIQDKRGVERDIVLGFDNATSYEDPAWHPHLNGVPGRYANRIKNGTFSIDSTTYHTDLNEKGLHTLHGGSNGWDYRDWTVESYTTDSITFSLRDSDGEMGFPGDVVAFVTYTLTPYQWGISMAALSLTKKTSIMLSSHTYWNLDGFQNPNTPLVLNHSLHMPYATRRIATDGILIPTGETRENKRGQAFDFWSKPKQLGRDLNRPVMDGACGSNCTGYDTAFVFDSDGPSEWESTPVATLVSRWSGIQVDVFTDQAAFQIYTCNNMNGTFPLKSTQGFPNRTSRPRVTEKYGCVVMEVEDWIDGINNPQWNRTEKQVFGPESGPYVLRARYDFSVKE